MYKVEAFIEKCLNSCLNQDISKENYEILCVNDGSPDNSAEIAKQIAKSNTNIRVINRQNGGLSAARNTGIENAKGEYIFFVDSDDWIADNCLGKISSILKAEEPDVLCICAANDIEGQPIRRMSYKGVEAMSGPQSMNYLYSSCAPFQIVRKGHLDENDIRFYEGIYHEDSEYTPRMRYLAKKVSFMDDIIYFVYQNPNSITRTVNVKKVYDVITVVAPHIHEFAIKYVDNKYRPVYNELIASGINTVLSNNSPLPDEDKTKVNQLLKERRFLIDDFKNANYGRYKIEWVLFRLFSSSIVNVFELMSRLAK